MDNDMSELAPSSRVANNVFGLGGPAPVVKDCPNYLVNSAQIPSDPDGGIHPRPLCVQGAARGTNASPTRRLSRAPTLSVGRDAADYLKTEVLKEVHPTMERILESHVAREVEKERLKETGEEAAPTTPEDALHTMATQLKASQFRIKKSKSFDDPKPVEEQKQGSAGFQQQQQERLKKLNNDSMTEAPVPVTHKYNFEECPKTPHMQESPVHQCGPYNVYTTLSPTTKELDALCKRINEDMSRVQVVVFIQLLKNEVLFFNGHPYTGQGTKERLAPATQDPTEEAESNPESPILDATQKEEPAPDASNPTGYSFTKPIWSKQLEALEASTEEASLAALELHKLNVNTPTEVYSETAERQHIAARVLTVPAPCFINAGNLHVFDTVHNFLLDRGTNSFEEGTAVVLCAYEAELQSQLRSLAVIPVTLSHSLAGLRRLERMQRAAADGSVDKLKTTDTSAAERVKIAHDRLLVRRKARGEKRKEKAADQRELMKEMKAKEAEEEAAALTKVNSNEGEFAPEDEAALPEAISPELQTKAAKEKAAKARKLQQLRDKIKRIEKRREWRHEEQELNYQQLTFKEVRDASIRIQSVFRGSKARRDHFVKKTCDHHVLYEATLTQFCSARSTVVDGDFANLKMMTQHLVDVDSSLFTTDRPVRPPAPRTFSRLRHTAKRVPAQYDGDVSSEDEIVEELIFASKAPPVTDQQTLWNPYFQLLRCLDFVGGSNGLKWLEEVHQQYAGVPSVVKRAFAILEEHMLHTYYCAFVALLIRGKLAGEETEPSPKQSPRNTSSPRSVDTSLAQTFSATDVTPKQWIQDNCQDILKYLNEPSLSSRCLVGSEDTHLNSSGPPQPLTPHHWQPPVGFNPSLSGGQGSLSGNPAGAPTSAMPGASMSPLLKPTPSGISNEHAAATRGMKLIADSSYHGLWESFGRTAQDSEELSPGLWRLCKNAPIYIAYDPLPYDEWKRAINAVASHHDEPPEELDNGEIERKPVSVTWVSTVSQPVVHVGDGTYVVAPINAVDKVMGADGKTVSGPALQVTRGVDLSGVKRVDPVAINMVTKHNGSFGAHPPEGGRRRSSQQGANIRNFAADAANATHGAGNGVGYPGDKMKFDDSAWLVPPSRVSHRATVFNIVNMMEWEHSVAMAVVKHLDDTDGLLHRLVRLQPDVCLKHVTSASVALIKHEHRVVRAFLQPKVEEKTATQKEERATRRTNPAMNRMKSVIGSSLAAGADPAAMSASFHDQQAKGSQPPSAGSDGVECPTPMGEQSGSPAVRKGTMRNPQRPKGEARIGRTMSRRGSASSRMSSGQATGMNQSSTSVRPSLMAEGSKSSIASVATVMKGKSSTTSTDPNLPGNRRSKSNEELPTNSRLVVRPHGAVWDQLRDEFQSHDGVEVHYARVPLVGGEADLGFLDQVDNFLSAVRTALLPSSFMPGKVRDVVTLAQSPVSQGPNLTSPSGGGRTASGTLRAGSGAGPSGNRAHEEKPPEFASPLVIGVSHAHHSFFATLVGVVVGVRSEWEMKGRAEEKREEAEADAAVMSPHGAPSVALNHLSSSAVMTKSLLTEKQNLARTNSIAGKRESFKKRESNGEGVTMLESTTNYTGEGVMMNVPEDGEPQDGEEGDEGGRRQSSAGTSPLQDCTSVPAVQQLLAVFPDASASVKFFNDVLLVQTTSAAALLAECHRSLSREDWNQLTDADRRVAIVEGVLRSEELVLLLLVHHFLVYQLESAEAAGGASTVLTVIPGPEESEDGVDVVLPSLGNFIGSYPALLEWWRTLDPWAVPQPEETAVEEEQFAFGGVCPDPMHTRYTNSYLRRRVYQQTPTVFM